MGRKRSFLGFLATLVLVFFTANVATAGGYTCPTYQRYVSCAENRYLAATDLSTDAKSVGNTCAQCPENSRTEANNSETSCQCLDHYTANGEYTTMTDACTPEKYTIEYELNGGYWPADTVSIPSYTYGTRVVINSKPKKDNYTFVGWCTDEVMFSCAETQEIGAEETGNKKFWALWERATFTVTFDSNGATSGTPSTTSITCTAGDTDTCVAADQGDMLKSGYVFKGWSKQRNTAANYYAMKAMDLTTDTTLYAVWESCGSCSTGTGVASCTVDVSNNTCVATATCSTGYENPTCSGLSCSCTLMQHTITIDKNGGSGSLTVNGITKTGTENITFTCNHGETITLPTWNGTTNALTKANSTFTGWNGGNTLTCDGNKTVTAVWESCGSCSTGTGVASCTVSVSNNTCGATATCSAGYENPTCSGLSCSCTLMQHTITIDKNGGSGSLTVNGITKTGTENITITCTHGNTVTLPTWNGTTNALTKANSTFTGWDKHATCTADMTILANWAKCTDATTGTGVSAGNAVLLGVTSNVCYYKHTCDKGYWHKNNGEEVTDHNINCTRCADGYREGTGTKEEGKCLGYATETGKQTSCVKPENADWYSCKPCTPGSCQYLRYKDGTLPDGVRVCVPENCQQTLLSYTCDADYYQNSDTVDKDSKCLKCGENSSTSDGNKAQLCKCIDGYSVNGTQDGNQHTTSAACQPITYNITYELNGGTNYDGAPTTYKFGVGATIDGTPTRSGYNFMGWCTDADLANCKTTQVIGTTELGDKKFYASWKSEKERTITYNTNGGTINGAYTKACNVDTATFDLPTNVTLAGHTFAGWYDNAERTGDEVKSVAKGACYSKLTFWAKWNECNQVVNGACSCDTDTYPDNGVCTSCVKSCQNVDEFTNGEYNVCDGKKDDLCYRSCTPDDVSNSAAVDGYYTKGGLNYCYPTQCKNDYYLKDKTCVQCPENSDQNCGGGSDWSCNLGYQKTADGLKCEPIEYTVELASAGATQYGQTSVTVTFNLKVPDVASLPSKTDYVFGGYYAEENCSGDQYYDKSGNGLRTWTTPNNGKLWACWRADTFTCTAGKAADGSECSAGYYCPGGTVSAPDKYDTANGCERKCALPGTSNAGATSYTKCFITEEVDITNSARDTVTGRGIQTLYYGGSTLGYSQDPNIVPTVCFDGYWRTDDNSPFCDPVGYGYYRSESENIRTQNACAALPGADGTVTTDTETSKQATDCYNKCLPITITNGVRNPVNATESYNGTEIPQCTYNTSCTDGHSAEGTECVANKYTITLDHNGGTSGTNAIYLLYNTQWQDANGNKITNVEIPVLGGQTFGGYLSGSTTIVNGSGTIVANPDIFTKHTTITAVWTQNPEVTCEAGKYYPGSGNECKTCPAGSYCEGVTTIEGLGEAGRKTCANLKGTYVAATDYDGNALPVTINSPEGAKKPSDCFATNVAYTPNLYTAGSQTCNYDATTNSYTAPFKDKVVITCAGGYALATDTAIVCTKAGKGNYSPDKDLWAYPCPENTDTNTGTAGKRGTTQGETAVSPENCVMDNLWYENTTSGQRRQCFWSIANQKYDTNCPQSTVVTCIAGYWYDASLFQSGSTEEKYCVPVGDGAWSPAQKDCEGEDERPTAAGCSTKRNVCPNGVLTGTETASSQNQCEGLCPENSYCIDGKEYSCATETGNEYPYSAAGSDEIGDCYKKTTDCPCTRDCPDQGNSVNSCVVKGAAKFNGIIYKANPDLCVLPETGKPESCPYKGVTCQDNYYFAGVYNASTKLIEGEWSCQLCSGLGEDYKLSRASGGYFPATHEIGNKACFKAVDLPCTEPVCPSGEGLKYCSYDKTDKKSLAGWKFYANDIIYPALEYDNYVCPATYDDGSYFGCKEGYDKNEDADIDPTDGSASDPSELCTPHVYTMTLDSNYDGGTDGVIYQKYNDGWYKDKEATSKIERVDIPEREGWTFAGYLSAPGAGVMVINSSGGFVTADAQDATYLSDMTLYASWSQNTYDCQPGKYYEANGSDSVLKDCVAPYYCPGVGKVAVGETGCRETCPTPKVIPLADPGTKANGQSDVTSCYANFATNPASGKELEYGDGTWECQYTGTSAQGDYAECDITVNSCDAGYYNQVGTNGCSQVDSGYYSPAGEKKQTPCTPKTNYTIGTDVVRDAQTDCYVICNTYIPTVSNSTKVYVTPGDEYSKMFYTNGGYPACQYTVECKKGYDPEPGANPQCKANGYSVTLNKNGGTGNIADSVSCIFDSECTLPATSVLKQAGYNTANKWCTNKDGTGTCYDAGTTVSENISADGTDITLYAIWTPAIFKIELSAPDADANASQGPIWLKYATGWYSDATATQQIQTLGTKLPEKGGSSYAFAGYVLNNVSIVDANGTLSSAVNALTVTTKDATAIAQWSKGFTECDAGKYYPGTGSACAVCEPNHYCPKGRYPTDSGNIGGLIQCPNQGMSEGGETAKDISVCYKEELPYTTYIDANKTQMRAQGTWTCNYDTVGYTNCHEDTVDIAWCAAGYWYDQAQTAIDCVQVGEDNWSAEADLLKYACPDGGNTNGATTSDALADCQKRVDTYVSNTNNAKGSYVCSARLDGQAVKYDQDCQTDTIEVTWCAGGYWYNEAKNDIDCVLVEQNYYSAEGDIDRTPCPHGGTTVVSNAATPNLICQKVKEYPGIDYTGPDVHGIGVRGCYYHESTDGQMFGDKQSDGYMSSCAQITMTKCNAGYWWQNGESVCKEVGHGHFGPIQDTDNSSHLTGRGACPDSGLTKGTTSVDAKACYLEKLSCFIANGSGEQTRFYDSVAVSDTAGYNICYVGNQIVECDTMCTITGCDTGFSEVEGACINCPEDNVCAPGEGQRSCATLTGGTHPKADLGTTDVAYCYTECSLAPNAYKMSGRDYYGIADQCEIEVCKAGFTLSGGKCVECPEGMICTPDDKEPKSCATLTGGEYTESANNSDSINDCYKVCKPYDVVNGIAVPVADKAYYPNDCDYEGQSTNGNPCEIVDGVCIETSCNYNFEMVDGVCKPCAREHAISYKPDGNCVVETCANGYHPNGKQCEEDVIECSAPNATIAKQTWIASKNAFGACIITECEEGYHLGANACQLDEQVCELEHGIGMREWNHKTNTWGECVATKCDPGYTNDPSQTNEMWKQCGRCNNMYSANGELAASSYVKECEIAACMYQGELYTLENNECRLICDTYSDETGSRRWNASRKKCERTCEPGYTSW